MVLDGVVGGLVGVGCVCGGVEGVEWDLRGSRWLGGLLGCEGGGT